MSKKVRVRFAPSPTGPLHIGGVRTALYNYLFAKKHGGDFLLRIEDTDQKRFVEGAEEYIIESLKWCGILPNEGQGIGGDLGPYKQSERMHIYREYADYLIEKDYAYYAFDTSEELDEQRERAKKESKNNFQYSAINRQYLKNSLSLSADEVAEKMKNGDSYVIRIKLPRNEEVRFYDEIRGWVVVNTAHMDDKVLYKSDGLPTYHLANIVDDYLMKISHVIRGEEWLPSAPLHVLLYKYLGWEDEMPKFAHLPLILKPDGNGKLSKRDGDRLGFPVFCTQFENPVSGEITEGFREKGFERDAFVNFIALLGWNDGTERELFDMDALIENFSLDKVHKAGAKFNFEKAVWFNQQYIRLVPNEKLAESAIGKIREANPNISDVFVSKYCELYRERISFSYELPNIGKYLYTDIENYDVKMFNKKWKPEFSEFFQSYILLLEKEDLSDSDKIEQFTKAVIEESGYGLGQILPLFRIGLTGTMKGPSIFETISILGKEESIKRLQKLKTIPTTA